MYEVDDIKQQQIFFSGTMIANIGIVFTPEGRRVNKLPYKVKIGKRNHESIHIYT